MAYRPSKPAINDVDQLRQWVEDELTAIQAEFAAQTLLIPLTQVHRAPSKPRAGMLVSADGTDWNPGAGAGIYEYRGGAWQKL